MLEKASWNKKIIVSLQKYPQFQPKRKQQAAKK